MNGAPLVLDAGGLAALIEPQPSPRVRALLTEAHKRNREVILPTLVCAEVARGRARTRAVEEVVSRHRRGRGERPMLRLVDTDLALARQVGAILDGAGAGSEHLVDAHVVAACIPFGAALVLTDDPEDITMLAASVPAVRLRVATLSSP